MKDVKEGIEQVVPALGPNIKSTTIVVSRENNTTTIDNGLGVKWTIKDVDEACAITALIAHTLVVRKELHESYANKFRIKLTIEETIF